MIGETEAEIKVKIIVRALAELRSQLIAEVDICMRLMI